MEFEYKQQKERVGSEVKSEKEIWAEKGWDNIESKEKYSFDKKEPEHPIFNRTGMILLLWILLMFAVFMWNQERRKCLTPDQRAYEDFKADY